MRIFNRFRSIYEKVKAYTNKHFACYVKDSTVLTEHLRMVAAPVTALRDEKRLKLMRLAYNQQDDIEVFPKVEDEGLVKAYYFHRGL